MNSKGLSAIIYLAIAGIVMASIALGISVAKIAGPPHIEDEQLITWNQDQLDQLTNI